jgi:hypothetical protein
LLSEHYFCNDVAMVVLCGRPFEASI